LLPALLASFRDRFPGIEVDLLDLPVDGVAKAVREGQADFGVCTADQEMVGMVATTLYQDRLMLACLADHPLAGRKELRRAKLAGEPLVPAFEVTHVSTAVGLLRPANCANASA
jgi:DNA-binding transcriptional LysR family regulator